MIDQWFEEDLQRIYDTHSVAVFIDESGDAEFLLKTVEKKFTIYPVDSEIQELQVKFLIEKAQPTQEKFLIYTRTKKEALKFVREYCETNDCLEIKYLQNYIKDKVHQILNLNINLLAEELVAAAKVSVGKDSTYWMDLSHKGAGEIFDLKRELLAFVHNPEAYAKEKFDAQLRETFYRKVNELLRQDYLSKPAVTLAGEVVKAMLDGLAESNCPKTLEYVYKAWLDSVTFRDSFDGYLSDYSLPENLDIWKVSIHHPFRQVDEKWVNEIGLNLSDYKNHPARMTKLRQRSQSNQARALGITFWADVITLLEFDPKDISYLSSFDECVDFYKKHFCKLDTAIRHLYVEFLSKKKLLEPLQELYKQYVSIFLDKWFKHWDGYKETQTGTLQRIIAGNSAKTAIIVGDGVAYEIAEQVAKKVKGLISLKRDAIIADIPSATENNMSRIYMDNGTLEPIQKNREKYLTEKNQGISIDFIRLNEISEKARAGQFLIITYKEFDDLGEKLQHKALKHFPASIDVLAQKISLLLASGYAKVYMVADHGFVLTGLLSEADKITCTPKGESSKAERYIRTQAKQVGLTPDLIEVEKVHKEFCYLYFARNINPFKTTGLYGFSHGGLSPQEVITPYYCWERSENAAALLSVVIANKTDLKDITGELFLIKIAADKGGDDLFSIERKVYLVFFANKIQVNKSEVFTIQRNESIVKEYTFDGHAELDVQILDATTKQQLDRTVVKQNKSRDLGGLL